MAVMKIGVVICSRLQSSRLPGKALRKVNGKSVLQHLVDRIKGVPVYLAVPHDEFVQYSLVEGVTGIYCGYPEDPMRRMYETAKTFGLDAVVRITHDKLFVESMLIQDAIHQFKTSGADYLYSTEFTEGSGFEIIKTSTLGEACERFKDVEFISYAIKAVTENQYHFKVADSYKSSHRFLIDYPEDLLLLEAILTQAGESCTLVDAIRLVDKSRHLKCINRLPEISVYTCSYNAEAWIEKCLHSVINQDVFRRSQYIVVDDFSSDRTFELIVKHCYKYKNIQIIRNQENLGLASSSNVALKHAKGKYIVRLDADDFFVNNLCLTRLYDKITELNCDAVYPHNFYGSFKKVQRGDAVHHVGGAIFNTRAINHIKFTDGLRGFEGYDFFKRAEVNKISIGYLPQPLFFYRQHEGSLSKSDPVLRNQIKESIDAQVARY